MQNKSQAEVAESYYDSSDADRFYEVVWGGEDLHIGIYEPGMSILEASRNTVRAMAAKLEGVDSSSRLVDLGAGFGGTARHLAGKFGCHVTCVNISETQNDRNRRLVKDEGLDGRVEVLHGSFEDIPCPDASFDVVWSQDSFLHSDDRTRIVAEIDRVLKPGGQAIFTDPMQADDVTEGALQPVYDRLNLDSLASIAFYREQFTARGYEEVAVEEMTGQLRTHYDTVRRSLQDRYEELRREISPGYMDRMITGLENWVKAADQGYLAWGILHFRKS